MARLLFPGLLAWVAGTLLQLQQPTLMAGSIYAGLLALALVLLGWIATKKIEKNSGRLLATLAMALLLSFGISGLRAVMFAQQSLASALEGRDITVTGVVASLPDRSESGLRFRLQVEAAAVQDQPVRLPPLIELGWYGGVFRGGADLVGGADPATELQLQPAEIVPGERWQMTVRLKAPHGASNPWGFDYELWLWEQGVGATGYVRVGPRDVAPRRLGQTGRYPVERWRQSVRDRIHSQVADPSQAGLIAALVVGDQRAIDRVDWDVFRATGVAHLMSISGLHVTMFAWLAAWLVDWLWRRSSRLCRAVPAVHAGLLGGLLLATGYALFSGWGLPAQRTVWMLAVVSLLRFLGRRWPWPTVWLLTCAVVVACDPWALLQPGFWLSFVAVGVLFASSDRHPQAQPQRGWGRLKGAVREQWIITLALTPLGLLLFGQVSLVGLAANALAIPWVTLLVTPLAMLGVLLDWMWQPAAWTIALLSAFLGQLAALPLASIYLPQAPWWAGVMGTLGGLLLVMPLPRPLRALGLSLMMPVLLWQSPRPQPGEFDLLAADVGQGNGVIVRTAEHALVFDAGPRFSTDSDAGHRVLVPLLRAQGLALDRLVLSHRDNDHVGGAGAILALQPRAALYASIGADHPLNALRPVQPCLAGERWDWDGVAFEFLHPGPDDYTRNLKSNALSCVLRISNGRQTALLAGDIEAPQEAWLVASRGPALAASVLLVPHHGSKTSSSDDFLDTVQPRIALVQSGYRNRYGHPAPTVLSRYAARQIEVFDSPHCGAARWDSSSPDLVHCQRTTQRRYWHHAVP